MFDPTDTDPSDGAGPAEAGAGAGAGAAAGVLARFGSVVDDLQALTLSGDSDDQVLALLRELEAQKTRLVAVDHAVIAEVAQRGLAAQRACASTAVLLAQLVRITPREAKARVAAAAALGPRRALTGQLLGPVFEATAGAVAAGRVSAQHAAIVVRAVERLPVALAAEVDVAVEAILLEQGEQHPPQLLGEFARALHERLDPDGILTQAADRRRRRDLRVAQRPDGSVSVAGELDAITGEALLSVLDTLARPVTADGDGEADRRTAGQRRHDALGEAMLRLLRSGTLPECGGVAASIILTLTPEHLHSGRGLVTTGHGASITVPEALSLTGDAQIQAVVLDSLRQITAYSSTRRIFSQSQRLAMSARDHGCSFPGCSIGPAWCQAHHITDYQLTARTSVDDGTLLCGYHHREHHHLGWRCQMINGVPHWTAPTWLDPQQTPRQNRAHNPAPHLVPT